MAKPISPSEVAAVQTATIPDAVFEAFNEAIAARFDGTVAVVVQDDLVNRLVAQGFYRHEIFARGWLNIEEAYRQTGWDVVYDRPAYNEDGQATFTFRRSKNQ